jgi:hypothetical protein
MNHLKNKINNNLLRLIGQYNMISKETVLTNKVKTIIDIYCLNIYKNIKEMTNHSNRTRINFPDIFNNADILALKKIMELID